MAYGSPVPKWQCKSLEEPTLNHSRGGSFSMGIMSTLELIESNYQGKDLRVADFIGEVVTEAEVVVGGAIAMNFEGDLISSSGKWPCGLTLG